MLVNAVVFSPYSKLMASASDDMVIKQWDAGTGSELHTLERHSGRVMAVVFSPNSKLVTSASSDKTVKLWDAGTGIELRTLTSKIMFFRSPFLTMSLGF
jgi:WD40 repeat protein